MRDSYDGAKAEVILSRCVWDIPQPRTKPICLKYILESLENGRGYEIKKSNSVYTIILHHLIQWFSHYVDRHFVNY